MPGSCRTCFSQQTVLIFSSDFSKTEGSQAVLEKAALVAGWVPLGKAQMAYVKSHMKATIVCNQMHGEAIDVWSRRRRFFYCNQLMLKEDLLNPVIFHNLDGALENRWSEISRWDLFTNIVSKRVAVRQVERPSAFRAAVELFCNKYVNLPVKIFSQGNSLGSG